MNMSAVKTQLKIKKINKKLAELQAEKKALLSQLRQANAEYLAGRKYKTETAWRKKNETTK